MPSMNDDKDLEIRADELPEPELSDIQDESFDDVEFVETDAMGDEKKDKAKIKSLREELNKSQLEAREHLTALQRSRADYINLKKELDETRDTTKKKTTEKIISEFLPILDSFDMAMANVAVWESVDKNWRVGIEYIYSQFHATLENQGVEAIGKIGVDFDPNLHEPIELIETDDVSQDHKIAKVIQMGYKMGDRVIRPARVVVWKAK